MFREVGKFEQAMSNPRCGFMKQGMGTQSEGLESWPDLEQVT